MTNKENFIGFLNYLNYLKQLAFLIKTALLKFFTQHYFNKFFLLTTFQNKIIKKITKSYTSATNIYSLYTMIILCLIAISVSYYQERDKFEQELSNKAQLVSFIIEENFNNYKGSLNEFAEIILTDQLYLKKDELIQLLKFAFTNDEHIKLKALTWHPIDEPDKVISAHGSLSHKPEESLLAKLNKTQDDFIIYNSLSNKQDGENISIIMRVLKVDSVVKDSKLVGYLKIPIEISSILQPLIYVFASDDLIKFTNHQGDSMYSTYFAKKQNEFKVTNNPVIPIEKYQFTKEISISSTPYKISIGEITSPFLKNTIQISLIWCGIILGLGSIILLIYNYVERKRIRKQCDEFFTEEMISLQQQAQELTKANKQDNSKDIKLLKISESIKAISTVEARIKQERDKSIDRIQDILKLKPFKNEEDLTLDIVKTLFDNISRLNEDLKHNIVSQDFELSEVHLNDLFKEITTIITPILEERSIIVTNKIKDVKLKINELIIKQILISLLTRSLYFIPNEGKITISANQDMTQNSVIIEIKDNGISFDEALVKSFPKTKNGILPSIANIQIESNIIELLIKERLGGNIEITNSHDGNQIIIIVPYEKDREDKVKLFPKINRNAIGYDND